MLEDDARRVLLVRAVEVEDAAETLLTREDRRAATAAASSEGGTVGDEAFLARRARFAFERASTRFPALGQAFRASAWPRWLNWLVLAGAFALGLLTNEVGNGRRLNLLAFPLLGMLAWNLFAYLVLLAGRVRALARRGGPARPAGLALLADRAAGLWRPHADRSQPLGRALARFAGDWARHGARLNGARSARTLHLGAAAFAGGVLAGLYLRALGVEYRAGWESTFLGVDAVHRILSLLLAPASAVTGVPLPDPDLLARLRWSAGGGENAGRWIHLYSATALLFIVVPRLLLAGGAGLAAERLKRRVRAPGRGDFYVRRVLREVQGGPVQVRVVPYGHRPSDAARGAVEDALAAALGAGARTSFDAAVPYGAEEEWLAGLSVGQDVDHLLLLFSLSSTPEAENHGALAAGLRAHVARVASGAAPAALVDEAAFRARLAGQADAEARLGARRAAWERTLAPHGLAPFFADFSDGVPALAQRLEAALMRTATMMPAEGRRR